MEILTSLDANTVVVFLTSLIALVSMIVALVQKIKQGKYVAAIDNGKTVAEKLMETIDEFKVIVKPAERQPIMKGLGEKLEVEGLKAQVDESLTLLGLSNKS